MEKTPTRSDIVDVDIVPRKFVEPAIRGFVLAFRKDEEMKDTWTLTKLLEATDCEGSLVPLLVALLLARQRESP